MKSTIKGFRIFGIIGILLGSLITINFRYDFYITSKIYAETPYDLGGKSLHMRTLMSTYNTITIVGVGILLISTGLLIAAFVLNKKRKTKHNTEEL